MRLLKLLLAMVVASSTLGIAPPATASSVKDQVTTARLDGIPKGGETLSVAISNQPPKSKTTYKWTGAGVVLSKTSSYAIPLSYNIGIPIQLTVTNTAPGFRSWTYQTPGISLGLINVLKIGKLVGNATAGLPFRIEPDETLPQQTDLNGNVQVTETEHWTIGGQTFQSTAPRTIVPSLNQIGEFISLRSDYTFPGLANTSTESRREFVYGVLTVTSPGVLSTNNWVGQTVSVVETPTFVEQPLYRFGYQWFRDGKAIAGQTAAGYKLVGADVNHRVSVKITGWPTNYLNPVTELTVPAVLKKAPR